MPHPAEQTDNWQTKADHYEYIMSLPSASRSRFFQFFALAREEDAKHRQRREQTYAHEELLHKRCGNDSVEATQGSIRTDLPSEPQRESMIEGELIFDDQKAAHDQNAVQNQHAVHEQHPTNNIWKAIRWIIENNMDPSGEVIPGAFIRLLKNLEQCNLDNMTELCQKTEASIPTALMEMARKEIQNEPDSIANLM